MTYSINVYYCPILVTFPGVLFIVMSHVCRVTLSDTYYTSCGDTLFMYTILCILCNLYSMYSL